VSYSAIPTGEQVPGATELTRLAGATLLCATALTRSAFDGSSATKTFTGSAVGGFSCRKGAVNPTPFQGCQVVRGRSPWAEAPGCIPARLWRFFRPTARLGEHRASVAPKRASHRTTIARLRRREGPFLETWESHVKPWSGAAEGPPVACVEHLPPRRHGESGRFMGWCVWLAARRWRPAVPEGRPGSASR
jgi:hypothetical protein